MAVRGWRKYCKESGSSIGKWCYVSQVGRPGIFGRVIKDECRKRKALRSWSYSKDTLPDMWTRKWYSSPTYQAIIRPVRCIGILIYCLSLTWEKRVWRSTWSWKLLFTIYILNIYRYPQSSPQIAVIVYQLLFSILTFYK